MLCAMSKVQQIEAELEKLTPAELRQIRDWLNDFVEDRMQISPEFEAAIQESEREMHSGIKPRVRKP
jgi:hypothetical protein